MRHQRWLIMVVILLGSFGIGLAQSATPAAKNDYGKAEAWLCRPGRADACKVDQTATIVPADGKLKEEPWRADPQAPIDCFYVYPTVSNDTTGNSDMEPGVEERRVIEHQFARFASVCRPYAPLYRQVTLTALRANLGGKPMPADRALAYNDVVDAWKYYLEHDNQGRGVVLIGHSQGSGALTQLIRNEIDGKPIQSRLISALLLGTNLAVPKGKDVGGAFKNIPLCRAANQTGCAIAYASFRADLPPPANTLFGRVAGEGMAAACVNPASLAGGSGELKAYLASAGRDFGTGAEAKPWVTPPQPIKTTFVTVPGLITAECASNENGTYLAVKVNANPEDPRTDDIVGDIVVFGKKQANWGLHMIDVQVAIGNLIDIVRQQAKAYAQQPATTRPPDPAATPQGVPGFKPPENIDFRTVRIVSEGVRIHAELYSLKSLAGKALPTVIQAHGWGGTAANFRWDSLALANAGYLVIAFDYRGWGQSDGRLVLVAPPEKKEGRTFTAQVEELREYVDPMEQLNDWFNVIHWAMGEPAVDKARIGLRGSSYSGGHVFYIAARDPRVKAIVSQVGAFDSQWVVATEAEAGKTFDEATRRARGELGYPEPRARVIGNLIGGPIRDKLVHYRVIDEAPKVKDCAVLFIVAEKEELFDNKDHAKLAYDRMPGTKKKYVNVPNITHYGIYRESRNEAIKMAIEWFDQYLKK